MLLDVQGSPKPISKAALVHLLGRLKDNLRLVVLNACYSTPQAEAITQVIDCVVGMNIAIGDAAAITFSAAFYRAIGFGRSIQSAFDLGVSAIMLEGISEESTPEIVASPGVDPACVVLLQRDLQNVATKPAVMRALAITNSPLFVGCGDEGLSDPNFGNFLSWLEAIETAAGVAWWMHGLQDRTSAPLAELAEQAAKGLAKELASVAAESWWREVALLSLRRSRLFCEAFFREMLEAGIAENHPDLAD